MSAIGALTGDRVQHGGDARLRSLARLPVKFAIAHSMRLPIAMGWPWPFVDLPFWDLDVGWYFWPPTSREPVSRFPFGPVPANPTERCIHRARGPPRPPSDPCVSPSLEPAPALQPRSASAQPSLPRGRRHRKRLDLSSDFLSRPLGFPALQHSAGPKSHLPCHLDDCRVPDGGSRIIHTTHCPPGITGSWDCFLSSHPSVSDSPPMTVSTVSVSPAPRPGPRPPSTHEPPSARLARLC